jgi:hypothetical protein
VDRRRRRNSRHAGAVGTGLLGPVTLREDGDELWAEASIDAARLLNAAGGGSQMAVVAGEGFSSRKRWRIA